MNRPRLLSAIVAATAALALGFAAIGSAADSTVTTSDGRPMVWTEWLGDNAPVAVLLWASWVPDADSTLADLETITAAANARGLDVVLVVVQEPLEDARESLSDIGVTWFHDRYGHLLKDYRVVSIPRLLVFAEDGRVVERLDVNMESLLAWGGG